MSDERVNIHIDGAARGNPGPAAFAFVIARPGHEVIEEARTLGTATNNVAEYTALVRALEKAAELGLRSLLVHSDSELLVKQMNGEYRVKNADLRDLYEDAQELKRQFDRVVIRHVPRAQNKRADELCNEALDGKLGSKPKPRPAAPAKPAPAAAEVSDAAVRDDCLACLEAAAQEWSRNGAASLKPGQVWEQLWSILQEAGVLRKRKG